MIVSSGFPVRIRENRQKKKSDRDESPAAEAKASTS
jgi:hypothetical protein